MFVVFNVTFNIFSVISWWSILLVEEIEGPGKKPPTMSQVNVNLYHIMLDTSYWSGFKLTSVVIGTDYLCSFKSNYHTITVTTAPKEYVYLININKIKTNKYHTLGTMPKLNYKIIEIRYLQHTNTRVFTFPAWCRQFSTLVLWAISHLVVKGRLKKEN